MLLTHSCNTCCLLRNLYFLFFCDITQHYHEKFVYILVVVFVVGNIFHLYLTIGLSFESNMFHGLFNNKTMLPANNRNLVRDPLNVIKPYYWFGSLQSLYGDVCCYALRLLKSKKSLNINTLPCNTKENQLLRC